jgi:methionine-rich copper-binding protein CopC
MAASSSTTRRPALVPSEKRARRRPSPVGFVTAVLVALAMLVAGGPAASAHDELTGSTPAEGASVTVLPPALELDFSNVPSGIGAQVQVVDEAGTDWADGAVQIVDRTATQALRDGAPAGAYTVNWRVVSSDSHPIEGTYTFTAQQGSTTVPDSASTAAPLDAQEDRAGETPTAGVSDFPWSIVLMIAALVAIALALAVTARKRLGADRS